MKHVSFPPVWSLAGLILFFAIGLHLNGVAAEDIAGTYTFEGTAKAKGPGGGTKSKKFKGEIKVKRKSVRLKIPVSVNGKVATCERTIKARLNKGLMRSPTRANRRATFVNAPCRNSKWSGSLRLKWIQHPEGYELSFSIGGINSELEPERITGKFTGSTGTLSTEENQPEEVLEEVLEEVPPADEGGG